MGRKSMAMLLVTGTLAGFAPFASMPHAAAQVSDQAITVAQVVQGEVTQKFTDTKGGDYMIAVNGQPYVVPLSLYDRVDVGTIVRFDGTSWTIVSGGI